MYACSWFLSSTPAQPILDQRPYGCKTFDTPKVGTVYVDPIESQDIHVHIFCILLIL